MSDDRMIAALLREREGYVRRGLDDRVAQVDEQLAHYGHQPEAEDRTTPPSGRTADSGQVTADAEQAASGSARGRQQRGSGSSQG
jgi:hypothetical protein